MAAQGGIPKKQGFVDHALVSGGGQLYDPSYGGDPFPGASLAAKLLAWQRASLSAIVYVGGSYTDANQNELFLRTQP